MCWLSGFWVLRAPPRPGFHLCVGASDCAPGLAFCFMGSNATSARHFLSVKKKVFSKKGGRQFNEWGVWQGFLQEKRFSEEVRASHWTDGLWKLQSCCPDPLPKSAFTLVLDFSFNFIFDERCTCEKKLRFYQSGANFQRWGGNVEK